MGGVMGPGFQAQYMMDLRSACNHPYIGTNFGPEASEEDLIDSCGKMQVLHQMLKMLSNDGHKTLVFSQFTRVLDIIAISLKIKGYKFCQLDGRTKLEERQDQVERFFKEKDLEVFLLSTRAGGLGINLTAADTCIIYDSDWNPQQDLQAQDRCHRIGQTKPVMIYRLVTANTIDQKIVERAAAKRKLEKMIIHKSKFKAGAENVKSSLQSISPQELLSLLDSKDYIGSMVANDKYNGQVFSDEQMDLLLDRSDLAWEGHKADQTAASASTGIKGVFQVVELDNKKPNLGSVKDEA